MLVSVSSYPPAKRTIGQTLRNRKANERNCEIPRKRHLHVTDEILADGTFWFLSRRLVFLFLIVIC